MAGISARDVGLLVLRVAVGGALVAHGTQKLFGWFSGAGLDKTAEGFHSIGFRPGRVNAVAAGLGEAGGGALLAVGLATPAAGAAVAGTMGVATSMHTSNGFFSADGGYEYPAVLGVIGTALALAGAGRLSLDHATGGRLARPWLRVLALAAVVPAVVVVLRRRARAIAAPAPVEERPAS